MAAEGFGSPFTLVGPLQLAIPIMKDHEAAGKEVMSTVPAVAAAA
jgi:hypothetical protein